MKNTRRIAGLALGFAILAVAGAPAFAQAPLKEVRVALAWLRNGQYSALMAADAKGFFAEEGLKLSLVDGGPGKNSVPAVGAGQADFGVHGGSQVFLARLAPQPVDIVAIGTLLQELPLSYITLANPGDPDPTPKDMEGKTVGIQADGEMFLKALADRNGVDMSKVKIETVLANAEPLLIGKVDYFSGMLHNQTYQVEIEAAKPDAPANLRGKVWKAVRFQEYGVPSYGDVIFTTSETIKTNPELVKHFLRAVGKGLQFILANPEETVALVDAYPGQIERADKLAWRLRIQNPLAKSTETDKNGLMWMSEKVWDDSMAFYKAADKIPRVIPASEMMTNAFNPQIEAK